MGVLVTTAATPRRAQAIEQLLMPAAEGPGAPS